MVRFKPKFAPIQTYSLLKTLIFSSKLYNNKIIHDKDRQTVLILWFVTSLSDKLMRSVFEFL